MTVSDSVIRPRIAVVLAAGRGTRMRSELPKVLHPVAGRPMISWVLDAARAAGCRRIVVIVGHGAERLRAAVAAPDVVFVTQEPQLGTGHALAQAAPAIEGAAQLLVLSGDVPLVSPRTLEKLVAPSAWGALAVAELDRPERLGRVLAAAHGGLERIVEAADASPEELEVRTVNAGLYALPAPEIFSYLDRLDDHNAQGELYLTDAVGAAAADGERLELVPLDDPSEAWGVNTRRQLGEVHRRLLERHLEALMDAGVTVLDPARTVVEPQVEVGADTVLHPGVSLLGKTRVGRGCTLHQGAWLHDTELGDGVTVKPYSVLDGAKVGPASQVGPFSRLRPGADLGHGVAVGNFVEVKNSRLADGVKAGHLAYLGDAEIGPEANIGAGVVTCNYDGQKKHKTKIGKGAFVGSDTMLVAPVTVGDDAVTGAGSVITQDVPDGALGVGRGRQRVIEDWARRRARHEES
ncbi:MAG: bifunctional UDP-N-acetylglucosamine diphosphorylase/glucosamine-1-phosphate N-acetyltransferase GlmU [Acidobacteria bacterium]|nr:bifunctional UDP-N-acetylglucosamine diphosphorylase/glucosamine-1-phosphate N-acetyltransferase GlmU [Acidobacteriota bacterium]